VIYKLAFHFTFHASRFLSPVWLLTIGYRLFHPTPAAYKTLSSSEDLSPIEVQPLPTLAKQNPFLNPKVREKGRMLSAPRFAAN